MYQSRHWAAEAAAPRGRWDGWSLAVNRRLFGPQCLANLHGEMDVFGFPGSQLPPVRGPNLFWLDFLRRLLRHLLRKASLPPKVGLSTLHFSRAMYAVVELIKADTERIRRRNKEVGGMFWHPFDLSFFSVFVLRSFLSKMGHINIQILYFPKQGVIYWTNFGWPSLAPYAPCWCSSPPSGQRKKGRETEGSEGRCLGPSVLAKLRDIFGFVGSQLPPVRGPVLDGLHFLRRSCRVLRRRRLGAWWRLYCCVLLLICAFTEERRTY